MAETITGALVFQAPPATSGALVFGADAGATSQDRRIGIAADLPGLDGHLTLGTGFGVKVFGFLPGLDGEVGVNYSSQTQRPLAAALGERFQQALPREVGTTGTTHDAARLRTQADARWQEAAPRAAASSARWRDAVHHRREADVRFQRALRSLAGFEGGWRDAQHRRIGADMRWQQGAPRRDSAEMRWQDTLRLRGGADVRFQEGVVYFVLVTAQATRAARSGHAWSARYQEAIRAPAGRWVRPVAPPVEPCYLPSGELVFSQAWDGSAALVFLCERHGAGPVDPEQPVSTVVVPIRRIYAVINSATLRRVEGNILIPTTSMSLTIDVESWTWGFSASVPGRALADLEPGGAGNPVEVEATINGVAYRALIEGIQRSRVFGRSDLSVTGRGKSAVLDAPYAPALNFSNAAAARTAQQLANDVLTMNGVGIGWSLDWGPEDWSVPAGAWAHQGSYISALNAIAGAAGAYLQPHRTAQSLSVLPRYPRAPWEWASVTPDFELPSAAVQKEGIEWVDRPRYNRVYVSGVQSGVLGRVTRAGTAGELEAPLVTDPLITTAAAARQRGLAVLADTGRQALVGLRLPVLAETGIIPPGKFVRYVDGATTRMGIVRAAQASVERSADSLEIWQTLKVETHVAA